MLAYIVRKFGGAEGSSLIEIPVPQHGPRQLLIKVRAAGLNPVDLATRRGDPGLRLVQPFRLPAVLGNELGKVCETSGRPRLARVLTVGEDVGHDAIELRI